MNIIKKTALLLATYSGLVLGVTTAAHAFGPIITEADSDRALATLLTSEQSHATKKIADYFI